MVLNMVKICEDRRKRMVEIMVGIGKGMILIFKGILIKYHLKENIKAKGTVI